MRLFRTSKFVVASLLALSACAPAHSRVVVRDRALANLGLYFYPSRSESRPSRATIFFLGNDVGFWQAHQELAERLAAAGYSVVGFDVKRFVSTLPDSLAERDRILSKVLPAIIRRAAHDIHEDNSPLILAGHSFGADIALWLEATDRIPGVIGVLALSPTIRGHLRVTALDLANASEPHESGSFSVAEEIAKIPARIPIALVRGSGDKRRSGDTELIRAGGSRLSYTVIPLASHSLKSLTLAGPIIVQTVNHLAASE